MYLPVTLGQADFGGAPTLARPLSSFSLPETEKEEYRVSVQLTSQKAAAMQDTYSSAKQQQSRAQQPQDRGAAN
jgi:hypothetical protein